MPREICMLRRGGNVLPALAFSYSIHRVPLLFLYPALWIRTTTTAEARPAFDIRDEQNSHDVRALSPTTNLLHSAGSADRSLNFSAREKNNQDDLDLASPRTWTYPENETEKGPNVAAQHHWCPPHSASSMSTVNDGGMLVRRVMRGTYRRQWETDGTIISGPRGLERAVDEQKFIRTAAEGKRGTFVRRVLSEFRKRQAQDVYDASVRQSFQDGTRKERNLPLADWRKILHHLKLQTPRQSIDWHDDALRILVPLRFVRKLFFGPNGNIWNIQTQHVCKIKLVEETSTNPGYRLVLLSGPTTSIARAAAEILRLAPDSSYGEHPLATPPPNGSVTWFPASQKCQPPQNSDSPYIRFRRKIPPTRAYMITQPTQWTGLSFATYVEHLTSIKMSGHAHKLLYKPGEIHQDIVMKLLRSVFLDPACEDVISVPALNNAIAYLVRHSYHSTVRELYLHMERIGLKWNVETYNILLRRAAKNQNIDWFQSILRTMRRSGCNPNANTWIAFIMVVENLQIKQHIIAYMKDSQLFHNIYVRKAICELLIKDEMRAALEEEISLDEFVGRMLSRYGRDWLTKISANQILDSLGSRGLISRCWDFIQFMRSEGVKPDEISIATILHHCERHGNLDGAMDIMRRICSINAFRPSESIFNCLFNMAWKGKLYATARVVWAYACLHAATSFLMRKRVKKSASTAFAYPTVINSLAGTTTAGMLWRSSAGPFILGHPFLLSLKFSSLLGLKRDFLEARESLREYESFHVQTLDYLISGQELLIEGHALVLESEDVDSEGQSELLEVGGYASNYQLRYLLPPPPSQPFPLRFDQSDAPSAALSYVPSTNRLIEKGIEKYIGISQDWIPERPFLELLLEAWEMDNEWESNGGLKTESPERHLQQLSAMAPKILLKRRVGLEESVLGRHPGSGKKGYGRSF